MDDLGIYLLHQHIQNSPANSEKLERKNTPEHRVSRAHCSLSGSPGVINNSLCKYQATEKFILSYVLLFVYATGNLFICLLTS